MAPTDGAFSETIKSLKSVGLARPTNGIKRTLWTIFNYFMIFSCIEFTIVTIYGTIMEDSSIYLKLEYTALIYATSSMTFRLIVLTIRNKELFSLFDKMQSLLQRMDDQNGTNSLQALKKKCRKYAYICAGQMTCVCFNGYIMAYVRYYVEGVEGPAPFEVAMPFERNNNIHAVVWYQILQLYGPVAVATSTSIIFVTLAAVTSQIIRNLTECFERIDETNVDYLLGPTVEWHSEVIMLTRETNAILALPELVDYLLSIQYISVSGFLLAQVGLTNTNTTKFSKYMGLYVGLMLNPILYCIGGHVVSGENERLYISVYHNKWYNLSPKMRRNLILPAIISRKGLSWNFDGFVTFDMVLYLGLIKQSYSLITFLKMVS